MQIYRLAIFLSLILCLHGYGVAKPWKGITPLHSMRADVERILGIKPAKSGLDEFEIDGDLVQIRYTAKECQPDGSERWNVPVGTVTSILIVFKTLRSFRALDLDLKRFKVKSTDVAGAKTYTDAVEGFSLEASEEADRVASFWYVQTEEDKQQLRCPNWREPDQN